MTDQKIQNIISVDNLTEFRKLPGIVSSVFIFIIGVTVFQDYLESNRSGYYVGWITKFLDTEGNLVCAMQPDDGAK